MHVPAGSWSRRQSLDPMLGSRDQACPSMARGTGGRLPGSAECSCQTIGLPVLGQQPNEAAIHIPGGTSGAPDQISASMKRLLRRHRQGTASVGAFPPRRFPRAPRLGGERGGRPRCGSSRARRQRRAAAALSRKPPSGRHRTCGLGPAPRRCPGPPIALYSMPVVRAAARVLVRRRPGLDRRLYAWQVGGFIQDPERRELLVPQLYEQFLPARPVFWCLKRRPAWHGANPSAAHPAAATLRSARPGDLRCPRPLSQPTGRPQLRRAVPQQRAASARRRRALRSSRPTAAGRQPRRQRIGNSR